MHPYIMNSSETDDPKCFKVYLRVFIMGLKRNRDEDPVVFKFESSNKRNSPTNRLEEETIPQAHGSTTLNHPISTPEEVNVNLKTTLDEYETKNNAEDIEDDFLDSSGNEEKKSKPSEDESINVPHNSSEARDDNIEIKNLECAEELKAPQVHSLPAQSETMDMWEPTLKKIINKCSEDLENKVEHNNKDGNEHLSLVRNAGCRVKQKAFHAVIPLEIASSSKTWSTQYQKIAAKCSHGIEEEPETFTGNEQEIHTNLVSHEEAKSSTVFENAVDEEPANNVEDESLHQDSLGENNKSMPYSFRAIVPSKWHSILKLQNSVRYGWKVASLVRMFENLPQESRALQQDKILVENPSMNLPDGDQNSSAVTGSVQDVRDESKEEHTNVSEAYVEESSSSPVAEVSTFQPDVFAKKLQRPEQGVGDVAPLVMLNYEHLNYVNIPPRKDMKLLSAINDMIVDKFKDNWNRSKQNKIKRESLRQRLTSQSCSNEESIYYEIKENSLYEDISEGKYKGYLSKAGSDSGLSSNATESSTNSLKSGKASNTTSGYDQQMFLKMAPIEKAKSTSDIDKESDQQDESPYHTIPERSCGSLRLDQASIGSSNISALISCPRIYGEYNYGSVSSRIIKQPRIPTLISVGYYDTLYDKVTKVKVLEEEKKVQEAIIKQASHAMLLCRSRRKMVDQDVRVAAERILLVATLRRDIIVKELEWNPDPPKNFQPISVTVSMRNFNFSRAILSPGNKYWKKHSWYFVLVLEAGTAVLASDAVEGGTEILFEDSFRFEGKLRDYPISVKLFAMSLKSFKMKNRKGPRMILPPVPSKDYVPAHSHFSLWGSCELRASQLSKPGKNSIKLTHISYEATLSNIFSVDVEMDLKIMAFRRGFLTIGVDEPNRLPIWDRRWCVLDGAKLKFWKYPNEEEVSEPLGQLDLLNVRSHEVQVVNKEFCPWPKCMTLDYVLPESGVKEYFMNADTPDEFNGWQQQLNSVLGYLSRWKSCQEVER